MSQLNNKHTSGSVDAVVGAVVDVRFDGELPAIYDALYVKEKSLTLEVQQHIGDGKVRTLAMGGTDGLARGVEVIASGHTIEVPVGNGTLGRIMNVLGEPIDEKGPVICDKESVDTQIPSCF